MGCARMLYYRYISEEPEEALKPRSRKIFNTGTKIHEQIQEYLHEVAKLAGASFKFADEVRFKVSNNKFADKYDIESTADGVVEVKTSSSIRFGLEIKSIKSELFSKLSSPKPEHIIQSHVYMRCLDLPLMVILYYNKNDSSVLEFPIVFDYKIWKAIADKIDYVRKCAIEKKAPGKEPHFFCKECKYYHICGSEPKAKASSIIRKPRRC
jgi:CRISPR/Cas system-associated exonuclease Cas4 (RecB family)